jgi:diguanylate cyclase
MVSTFVMILYGLTVSLMGALYGWWLAKRNETPHPAPSPSSDEMEWMREMVSHLDELASGMSTSVGEHSNQVREVTQSLASMDREDPKAVAAAVARLVDANKLLEQELGSARTQLEEQARQIAIHATEARTDALTRLANRRAFDDELNRRFDELARHGRSFSLMMLDIDHFKQFNDAYGHLVGDEVLRGLAGALRSKTRTMDMVARYGGEEFAVIMPGTEIEDAKLAAERLRAAIGQAGFRYDGRDFHVTISAGVTEIQSSENAGRLLHRTDEALYAAKTAGRNAVWYHTGRECRPVREEETTSEAASHDVTRPQVHGDDPPHGVEQPANTPQRDICGDVPDVWFESTLRFADRPAFCQQLRCRLAEWKRGGNPFSVLCVELDDFASFCERQGAEAGEAAVAGLAKIVTGATREMDVVARNSPTGFVVLLPRAELSAAAHVADRLHEAMSGGGVVDPADDDARVTVSVGLAHVTDGDDVVRLLKRVETAVQSAQAKGGGLTHVHNGQWTEPVADLVGSVG